VTPQPGAIETTRGRRRGFPGGALLAAAAAALLIPGCGYVGDPQPPALKIPVPVRDLTAVERGGSIVVSFTATGETTEGLRLKRYGEVELRIGPGGPPPFDHARWAAGAKRVPVAPPAEFGRVEVEIPAAGWAGREVIIGVRLANPHGRWSSWSNLVALQVVEPLPAPESLSARAVRQGVKLEWSLPPAPPGVRFRIQRRVNGSAEFAPAGETRDRAWVDTAAEYGVRYEYRVQAILPAGDGIAESEWSAPAAITPQDRFAPPPPTGLTAVAALGSIELVWETVEAGDLAGYRVYRSDGGPEQAVSDLLEAPAFSDRNVAGGKRYRYRVTAVDRNGNESEPSAPVEAVAP